MRKKSLLDTMLPSINDFLLIQRHCDAEGKKVEEEKIPGSIFFRGIVGGRKKFYCSLKGGGERRGRRRKIRFLSQGGKNRPSPAAAYSTIPTSMHALILAPFMQVIPTTEQTTDISQLLTCFSFLSFSLSSWSSVTDEGNLKPDLQMVFHWSSGILYHTNIFTILGWRNLPTFMSSNRFVSGMMMMMQNVAGPIQLNLAKDRYLSLFF